MSPCLPLVLGVVLQAPAPAPSAAPRTPSATYVIVHGAWGGGWDWRKTDDQLTAAGATVFRPTLTGLGARVHLARPDIGLSTHVTDVVNEILFEDLREVVLVGHSYGGMVISGAAEQVPDRIRRLVFVDAFVPEDGDSVMGGPREEGRSAWLRSLEKDGFLIPPWVQPGQAVPKDVPHPMKTFTDPISLKNEAARRLPATYILTMDKGAQKDDFSTHADRARSRGWTVVQLEADHNPQRSARDALVRILTTLP
jgi:pimeloyl-ACP methyl ester carboxylesterase